MISGINLPVGFKHTAYAVRWLGTTFKLSYQVVTFVLTQQPTVRPAADSCFNLQGDTPARKTSCRNTTAYAVSRLTLIQFYLLFLLLLYV